MDEASTRPRQANAALQSGDPDRNRHTPSWVTQASVAEPGVPVQLGLGYHHRVVRVPLIDQISNPVVQERVQRVVR